MKEGINEWTDCGSGKEQIAVAVKNERDSEKRKSKVEIMTDFIKLNDEIVVCVAVTVDDYRYWNYKQVTACLLILHQWYNI